LFEAKSELRRPLVGGRQGWFVVEVVALSPDEGHLVLRFRVRPSQTYAAKATFAQVSAPAVSMPLCENISLFWNFQVSLPISKVAVPDFFLSTVSQIFLQIPIDYFTGTIPRYFSII